MIEAIHFKQLLDFVYQAHQEHAREGTSTTRQRGSAPFSAHPLWCALMVLNDATLPQEDREVGFQALLLHDVLEDTMLPLPDFVSPEVAQLVQDMTYASWEEERTQVLTKSPLLQLLKLVDKAASIYDRGISARKRAEWRVLCLTLLDNTAVLYGHTQVYRQMQQIVQAWKIHE